MTKRFEINRRDLLASAAAISVAASASRARAASDFPASTPTAALDFARTEILKAAAAAKSTPPTVTFKLEPSLGAQSFQILRLGTSVQVIGGDVAGAMYGGLDVAEALRLGGLDRLAHARVQRPYILQRGIKFNIPLDLRTPTYSGWSDAATANVAEVWSRDFWASFFDEMAKQRFNVLSLWNLHPFPSLVRTPDFPDVALNEVWRSRDPIGQPFSRPTGAAPYNYEVVNTLTIDQKIAFWRDVMQMASDRGVAIYLFTWNVFVNGVDGKYGITNNMSNKTTVAYTRSSVRTLLKTYPLLAGIGLTPGEAMVADNPDYTQEGWLWATYGEGIRDALKETPDRKFRLIHRLHQTTAAAIDAAWDQYPGYPETLTYSFKYSVAHMFSIANPIWYKQDALPQLKPGRKTWLTVRNDDIYSFRWGDPDYARSYINNMPPASQMAGFYMGADGYTWGRDFLDRASFGKALGAARPLVMQKQWYLFMLFGRLAYDPTLPNAHFQATFKARFPEVDANDLFKASTAASKVIPAATQAFWKDIDYLWFPEACTRRGSRTASGFYTVADFMNNVGMPGTDYLSVRRWRHQVLNSLPLTGSSPLRAADQLANAGKAALEGAAKVRISPAVQRNEELRQTLGDFEAQGHLGHYYAEKLRGACELAMYDATGDAEQKARAIAHLETALDHWKQYAAIRDGQYVPANYSRLGYIDVTAYVADAARDIEIARDWRPNTLKFDPALPDQTRTPDPLMIDTQKGPAN